MKKSKNISNNKEKESSKSEMISYTDFSQLVKLYGKKKAQKIHFTMQGQFVGKSKVN